MIDRKALLNDLKQQVKAVESDLGRQVKAVPEVGAKLKGEYERARKLGRTAATWNSWLDERITQVGVAWVLGSVFVRFSEDNGLIPEPYLTAPDIDRRELAEARYDDYVKTDADPTYRGWLERAFDELGEGQAGRLLFNRRHNPLYQIPLSHDGARELVEFWRGRDEAGVLTHDFTDALNANGDGTEGWDTRFLGDLYQDLSEAARKTYALLQTPEFVEEFILDRTMDPAVREFGYEGLKMIDPTCGSGHFVLGAFRRLVRLWGEGQPGRDVHERVRAALDSVHGVDLNPFAVAIARFRLLVAAMAASGVRTMAEAAKYEWPIHLAVGDSLIKARQLELTLGGDEDGDGADPLASFAYVTEDVHEHPGILQQGRYHVVVGNPPYITVKDKTLNSLYRELYDACFREYALSVPFAQRFFELAKAGDGQGYGYGMVGQITANSFMKREFGKKLIEDYFRDRIELTEVIDTSGAHIPGHGTPTVILIGRRNSGQSRSVNMRTVRGIQGEPVAPQDPSAGFVWNSIREQINAPASESEWVSVDDVARDSMSTHPWSLTGGAAVGVLQSLSEQEINLRDVVAEVGLSIVTGEDSAFGLSNTKAIAEQDVRRAQVVDGQHVRDWALRESTWLANPYMEDFSLGNESENRGLMQFMWPLRHSLEVRKKFSVTLLERGIPWFEWREVYRSKLSAASLLVFPLVATHNHFYFQREVIPAKHSATVIKMNVGASEQEGLRLLGLLNSSTAGFWLKMVCHNKGGGGIGGGIAAEHWEQFYEFTGTKLLEFPLPAGYPGRLSAELDFLARELADATPSALVAREVPSAALLRDARDGYEVVRAKMIASQEELDWQVYSLYNLHSEDLRASEADVPELALGERAFEIVLARRVAAGEDSGEWFKRHGSTPITEIPADWPAAYREIVQKRIDAIESNRAIGMVERPEYKRRWVTEGWDAMQEKALRSWLLDRIEDKAHWYDADGQPALVTLARLTDSLSRDEDFVSVSQLYAPRKDFAKVVAELMTEEHVPFLSALRYKPSGLKKRSDWEHVWDLQRQEDAAPDEPAKRKIRDGIPVPPKYTSADFLRPSYWRARGKLDVPKERFISYGQTNAATPDLYGWAGWDHREQAQALATYFTNHPLTTEEITPLLAGLLELQPWLNQWHGEFDMLYSGSPADFFAGYRQTQQGEHGLTDDDLREWRPVAATRGRRAAAKK